MTARFTVQGDVQVRDELRRLGKRYPQAIGSALYKLGVGIISDALPRTPVEFGPLRASHYVSAPAGHGSSTDVEAGYGTVYAVEQHENLRYRHPRGGEAKYLEHAVQAISPRALPLLAKWTEDASTTGGFGGTSGMPTRPTVTSSTARRPSQVARMARAAANVRRRTGRP
jgi:hypothetical protein